MKTVHIEIRKGMCGKCRKTICRYVVEIVRFNASTLKNRSLKYKDESTDVTSTTQVEIFIRGVDDAFNVAEGFAALYPLKGVTNSRYLFEEFVSTLNLFALKFYNLPGVTMDGAPAMVGNA